MQFYALIHDVVEVYAGDTYFYGVTEEVAREKREREKAATERLLGEFANWTMFCEALQKYEVRADDEARFVYAMDKIAPILTTMIDGGRMWREKNITLEQQIEKK